MSSEQTHKETDCTISDRIWRCYERGGPAHDGAWEFQQTISDVEGAQAAAARQCISAWSSGTHTILVVNASEAREFRVTVEFEEVLTGE